VAAAAAATARLPGRGGAADDHRRLALRPGGRHPAIVWDEIVGYLVTMVAAPAGWLPMLLGFVLFRAFDILKPWPIRWLDRKVHGGLGIMADDLLAGLFAAVALQVALISM
jgi:phosphatidylglycerophosphatase A